MKKIYKILSFALLIGCVIALGSMNVLADTGYTYDHKGKLIYSTEGFTVNETPYIYSDLGIDSLEKFSTPTDLFVYDADPDAGTIIYLLDGATYKDVNTCSRLYLLNDNLNLTREISYFVYSPNDLSDNELLKMKSGGIDVINANNDPSTTIDVDMAEISNGFNSLEDMRHYGLVKLYMSGASAVYRMLKTNSTPHTDYIYICDTGNNQVLVVDATSYDDTLQTYKIVQIITSPTEELGSDTFRPIKVTADAAGRIYVIANGVTNGIMEFSEDGTFDRYIGTNYVTLSAWDIFWRNFATESQLSNSVSILPTTFTSMTYKNNMIYTTSYAVSNIDGTTNDKIMIKKINPSGKDVLRRNGYTIPKGDFVYNRVNDGYGSYGTSTLEGITVNEYGVYTVVDSNRGRLFTYDNEGNLLYISGGSGSQINKISIPEAVQYLGENVLVLDSKKKAIIVFEPTDIARVINNAIKCEYEGRNEGEWVDDDNDPNTPDVYVKGAYDYWEEVILLNANYEYAYVGIGKHYLNNKDYKTAMAYFKLGYDKVYYGNAYKLYRDSIIKANFAWVFITLFVVIVGIVVFRKVWRKKRGIKEEEMTGIGDE